MDGRNRNWYGLCIAMIVISVAAFVIGLATGACTGSIETAAGAQVPMKCYWTIRITAFAMLIPAVMSAVNIVLKNRAASAAAAAAIILVSLLMLFIMSDMGIGICATAGMHCKITAGIMRAASVLMMVLAVIQVLTCRYGNNADTDVHKDVCGDKAAEERPKRRF